MDISELNIPIFQSLPLLKSGRAQTIAASVWPRFPDQKTTASYQVSLPDGDQLVIMENRPVTWKDGKRIAVLVHGLTGYFQSHYMVRLSRKLTSLGLLVVRVNLRGCGPGFGYAKNPYHSGRSEDTRAIIKWLAQRFPASPVIQIGFSLGGNITLKMTGEDGSTPPGNLDGTVAISPPIDLAATAIKIRQPANRLFDQYFVMRLRREIRRLEKRFPELKPIHLPSNLSLSEFDDFYTAPRGGFTDAQDYYRKASAAPLIAAIRIPTLILYSLDDPVVDENSFLKLKPPKDVDLVISSGGGHVAFLGSGLPLGEVQWMDHLIVNWMKAKGFI